MSRDPLDFSGRLRCWKRACVDADGMSIDEHSLRALAAQFVCAAEDIHASIAHAHAHAHASASDAAPAELAELLWDHCRARARPGMRGLADPVEARASFDDLVLPEHHMRVLASIAMTLRHRVRVLHDWGFAQRGAEPGVSAVFAGQRGTGKTMAAEAIAHAARLDLYRVELGRLLGSRARETIEGLAQLFDAARAGDCVLLFDDADALLDASPSMRDAALERGYLLQRMRAHQGATIFTTSPREDLDGELLRHARYLLDFPLPPMELREQLWRRMFPPELPTAGLAFHKFSRLELSGGTIRQIVLHAAYIAAEADRPVTMEIVLAAARFEYAKRGDTLAEDDIRGWV